MNKIITLIYFVAVVLAVVNLFVDGCTSLADVIIMIALLANALRIRKLEKRIEENKNE